MTPPSRRERARGFVRTAGVAGWTAAVVPPFAAHLRHTRRAPEELPALRDAWVKVWARGLLRMFAIELAQEGASPPRADGRGRLIVANHRSAIDIGAVLVAFGGALVSRHDLADWPLIGPGAKAADTLFVDRSLPQSGAVVLRALQRRLAAGGTITVFPEGTTFDGDEVHPFQRGAFVAALAARAEILPVGLAYPAAAQAAFVEDSFTEHLGRLARKPGMRVGLAVGSVLAPVAGERAAELAERARMEVDGLVRRARARVGP